MSTLFSLIGVGVLILALILLFVGLFLNARNKNEKKKDELVGNYPQPIAEIDSINGETSKLIIDNEENLNLETNSKPPNEHRNVKTVIFVILTIIILIYICGSCSSNDTTMKNQKIDYTLSADQLYYEYELNGVAADNKFEDKIVVISGRIYSIDKDFSGTPYLVIGGSGFLDGVQCMFNRSEEPSLSRLSIGQVVSAKGKVSGRVIGSVIVRQCILQ